MLQEYWASTVIFIRNFFSVYERSVEIVVKNFVEENFSAYTEIQTYALTYRSTSHDAIHQTT